MFYMSWFEKGVRTINDLFDNNGSLLSFRVFSENYNVRAMFLECEGLLAAVRNYLAQFSFRHMSNNGSNPLCSLIISIVLSQVKGSRKLYDILMKTNTLPNSTNKWQRDLNNN